MNVVLNLLSLRSIRGLTIIVSSILSLTCSSEVRAQNAWGIRVNQNTDIFTITNMSYKPSTEQRKVNFTRVSLGVVYKSPKWSHEFEVFVPEIKASFSHVQFPWSHDAYLGEGAKKRFTSYSVRYALVKNVYSVTDQINFALGLGLNPYYQKFESIPVQENIYYVSNTTVGASINVMPAFNFDLLEHRLTITADCPFKVFDFFHRELFVRNPAIPIRQQKMTETTSEFFMNAYTVRVGVSYWFGRAAVAQQKN